MRHVSPAERRRLLVRRHLLDGSATGPEAVVSAVVALHATDPASVYLSVLARSAGTTVADVAAALYGRRTIVRWTAMRRTLFVFGGDDIPTVQAAVSGPLADRLRRALLARIERNGTEPPIEGDRTAWLSDLEDRVVASLRGVGPATGAELRALEPALGTVVRARTPSEQPQALTSPVLTVVSTAGRIVRGAAVGGWTTRNQRWEPIESLRPEGVPAMDPADARAGLAQRWLERFGPATVEDLQRWTGWSASETRAAVGRLDVVDLDLHGRPGIDLADADSDPDAAQPDSAALLPALDPTPMGWKHREWFTAVDRSSLYDRAGNIGPTVWWNGELVGCWASTEGGIRMRIVADRGRDAAVALDAAAHDLERRLEGAVIRPAVATPLERRLASALE